MREKSGQSFYLQQLVYFTVNAVAIMLVIYKCKTIGLVPSTEGDWLEFITIGAVCQREMRGRLSGGERLRASPLEHPFLLFMVSSPCVSNPTAERVLFRWCEHVEQDSSKHAPSAVYNTRLYLGLTEY